jgi:hypothetical protein
MGPQHRKLYTIGRDAIPRRGLGSTHQRWSNLADVSGVRAAKLRSVIVMERSSFKGASGSPFVFPSAMGFAAPKQINLRCDVIFDTNFGCSEANQAISGQSLAKSGKVQPGESLNLAATSYE